MGLYFIILILIPFTALEVEPITLSAPNCVCLQAVTTIDNIDQNTKPVQNSHSRKFVKENVLSPESLIALKLNTFLY